MSYRKLIGLLLLALVYAPGVQAYIGAIGSPVVPSNPGPADVPDVGGSPLYVQATAQGNPVSSEPSLVIHFTQGHAYFEQELKQMVIQAQINGANPSYKVFLIIPTGNDKQALHNLQEVVDSMKNMGVSPAKIHTNTVTSTTEINPEIQIYIQ